MWAFRLDIDKKYHHRDVFSRQIDLAYDSISLLGVIYKSTHLEMTSLQWYYLQIIQAHLPQQPSFL